uniref:Probable peptidoglycan glycosyltransferase FtsW n=1 Tax=Candidatus Aschnera chinzeii TaxID=1485666 RepID=A0AAT9G4K6_9ENTR|nr:MAG: cell division protein FtsW [Candidatus Aschnera chinzeii]
MYIYKKFKKWINNKKNNNTFNIILYDRILVWCTLCLTIIGFIMVTSASIPISQHLTNDPYYFAKRNIIYLIISFIIVLIVLNTSMMWWENNSIILLLICLLLLIIVLFWGSNIHGASRWLNIWILHMQPSEFGKLSLFCYISNHITKNNKKKNKINHTYAICILFTYTILLLLQPDLGTVIITYITILVLIFISITKITPFIIGFIVTSIILPILIYFTPYRLQRITSFLNPWDDPFGNGYQLIQSLIAFGRGKIWGEGLGNSIQKLEYLPEAHTDFIFSILAEELGYTGVITMIIMLFFIAFRGIIIGKHALDINLYFSGYLAYSIGIWLTFQIIINISGTIGILPTKGLTLPLISYGGSSLLTIFIAIAILLRVDFETRINNIQVCIRKNK